MSARRSLPLPSPKGPRCCYSYSIACFPGLQVVKAWQAPAGGLPPRLQGVLQVQGGAQPRTGKWGLARQQRGAAAEVASV